MWENVRPSLFKLGVTYASVALRSTRGTLGAFNQEGAFCVIVKPMDHLQLYQIGSGRHDLDI